MNSGRAFFAIPEVSSEVRSQDQLHHAYIKVVQGEVNARHVEEEFDSWALSVGMKWRFYTKMAAHGEFIARFPSDQALDDLAYFGKLFMKKAPGAIVDIPKGVEEVEPVGHLEKAWFRVKGIPRKYQNKESILRVCAMAGKPIARDMNTIRNFAYVSEDWMH